MKILFISPDIEEKTRGITVILKELMKSAGELGHEVGLITSYPRYNLRSDVVVDEKLQHRFLQDYLSQGRDSYVKLVKDGYTKLNMIRSILNLSFFRPRYMKVDKGFFSDKNGFGPTLDFTINSPFFYQFMVRNFGWMTKFMLKRIARRFDFDAVIIPYPSLIDNSYLPDKKLAYFIHDLMPFELSETPNDQNTPIRFAKKVSAAINGADMLFANSQDTKEKIRDINPDIPVHVLYGVASANPGQIAETNVLEKFKLKPKRYLLFISTIESRKNVERLIDAHADFYKETGLKLVLVGGRGWGEDKVADKYENLSSDHKKNVVFTDYVSEADKYTLLNNALLFTFPSLHEGIGLILLEAMQAGIPIVTTRRGALPEAAGDAALYVEDPYDANEISEKIQQLINDESLREKLVSAGDEQIEKFTHEKFKSRLKKALEQW